MSLALIQEDFRLWLEQADQDAANRLGPGAQAGLTIYQNNYRTQLAETLADTYVQLSAWIGEDAFLAVAATHIDAVPPSSWTLDAYPAGFPHTLASCFPEDPEVAELARLELTLADAFVAADAQTLGLDDLAGTDWSKASLRLSPSARLLKLQSNAAEIWSALAKGTEPPAAASGDESRGLIVWRRDFICRFRMLDPDEETLLARLGDGMAFERICEELAENRGVEAGIARAGALLARWAGDGFLMVCD